MKKYIYYIMLVALFTTSSCDDFLNVEVTGSVTEDDFYTNINEFQLSLYAVYSVLRTDDFQNSLPLIADGISDDFIYQRNNSDEYGEDGFRLENFDIQTDNVWVEKWYSVNYNGIFKANQLLAHINDSIDIKYVDNYDDEVRRWQHIYGQTLFLRAYYYFNLVRTFGGVSIIPETQDIENSVIPRSTVEETYEFIEKDLRTACVILGEIIEAGDYGEVSQYAGLSLLMKVLVAQAKQGEASKYWEEAKNLGQTLVANQGSTSATLSYNDILKLDEFYPDMTWDEWKEKFKMSYRVDAREQTELSKEEGSGTFQSYSRLSPRHGLMDWPSMWRVAKQNLTTSTEAIFSVLSMNAVGMDPSQLNLLNVKDGLYAIGVSDNDYVQALIPSLDLYQAMTSKDGMDPRNYYGCYEHQMKPYNKFPDEYQTSSGGVSTENFMRFVKYFLIEATERITGVDGSPRNFVLMRYSDILLLYAAALNETGDQ
ncbi:MAG: RagB/SusD family nutrient uptake outer membrane protein, partial [Bacteroidales bacterium]|nr:RagB/SusD family nutrient uptake outer membrane protein [Bacteroidales bacterium]